MWRDDGSEIVLNVMLSGVLVGDLLPLPQRKQRNLIMMDVCSLVRWLRGDLHVSGQCERPRARVVPPHLPRLPIRPERV